MIPYFHSRELDQDLLSSFLDDVDLSDKFHLDTFCLIQRYLFIRKSSFVNVIMIGREHDSAFFCRLDDSMLNPIVCRFKMQGSTVSHISSDVFVLENSNGQICRFDPIKNQISTLPDTSYDHKWGEINLLNVESCQKSLMVAGGFDLSNPVEEFTFTKNEWQSLAPMKQGRFCFASVVVEQNSCHQNHILVMGGLIYFSDDVYGDGWGRVTSRRAVEMLSKETNTWTRLKDMTVEKAHFFGTMFQDKVVAGPCRDHLGNATDVSWFDFHKQNWYQIPHYPVDKSICDKPVRTTNVFCRLRNFFGCRLVVVFIDRKPKVLVFDHNTDVWETINLTQTNAFGSATLVAI